MNGSGPPNGSIVSSNNNNNGSIPNGTLKPETIQCTTNENVYYSQIPVQTEKLVQNSEKSTLKTHANSLAHQRSMTRVSWAQPVASRLPVSPPSEDESANSDTPLYENTMRNGSPKMSPAPPRPRPISSPDSSDAMRKFETSIAAGAGGISNSNSNLSNAKPAARQPPKREFSFSGSTAALSRLAAAVPSFVRNSWRGGSSAEDNGNLKANSMSRLNKNFPRSINRENIEISKPILTSDMGTDKIHNLISITSGEDVADSPSKGAKRFVANDDINIGKKASTPPPVRASTQVRPKVVRANSMTQASKRNSGGNPNYNSLRKPRPSAPPPKPPKEKPPPPPMPDLKTARTNFFKSLTPPPVPPPNNELIIGGLSKLRPTPLPSILKPTVNKVNYAAPIAQQEVTELPSPKVDNIYDTIDERMASKLAQQTSPEYSSTSPSSEEEDAANTRKVEDKVETLSTASSESNNGGLLSEIISEIQTRNRESIYNSLDRRKLRKNKGDSSTTDKIGDSSNDNSAPLTITTLPNLKTGKKEDGVRSYTKAPTTNTPALSSLFKPKPPPAFNSSIVSECKEKSSPKTGLFSYTKPKSASPTYKTGLSSGISNFPFNKPLPAEPEEGSDNMDQPTVKSGSPPPKSTIHDTKTGTSIFSSYFRPASPKLGSMRGKLPSYGRSSSPKEDDSGISSGSSSRRSSSPQRDEIKSSFNRPSSPRSSVSSSNSSPPPTSAAEQPSKFSLYKKPSGPSFSTGNSLFSSPKPVVPSSTGNAASVVNTSTTVVSSANKPTCAVNGIPKVTHASPTYMAKISHYASPGTIGCGNQQLMKPVNSIPEPSNKENAAKEIIYASTAGIIGEDNDGRGSREHLSTIRPAWSRPYYNDGEEPLAGSKMMRRSGIYGSLGRKVATPVIRANTIERDKADKKDTGSSSSTENANSLTEDEKNSNSSSSGGMSKEEVASGYKPFNPYLNRPLTFSTFRPVSSGKPQSTALAGSCSAVSSGGKSSAIVGVTSPTVHTSPTRLVKS